MRGQRANGNSLGRRRKGGFNRGRGGKRGGGGRPQAVFSDLSQFVNKAVITEEAPVFVPEHSFGDFAIDTRLKKNITDKGYTVPTPIQDRAIVHILRGEDVVGVANTGTGALSLGPCREAAFLPSQAGHY